MTGVRRFQVTLGVTRLRCYCLAAMVLAVVAGVGARHALKPRMEPTDISGICVRQKRIGVGVVERGSTTSVAFDLMNDGDDLVTIESVQTDCGCTTAGVSQKTIAPGETVSIPVSFQATKEIANAFHHTVIISLHERSNRELRRLKLDIEGSVAAD